MVGLKARFNHTEWEHRLVRWLIASDQPFIEVKQRGFMEMVLYLRPSTHIPSPTTIHRRVMDMGRSTVKTIKEWVKVHPPQSPPRYLQYSHLLQELESDVSLSLDNWTSSNNYAFMGIVMHYISNDWKLGWRFILHCH